MQLMKLCAVLACVAVLGCGPRGITSQQRRVETGFVEGRVEMWTQLVNNGDLDSLMTMYHNVPDLTTVWTDGTLDSGLLGNGGASQLRGAKSRSASAKPGCGRHDVPALH